MAAKKGLLDKDAITGVSTDSKPKAMAATKKATAKRAVKKVVKKKAVKKKTVAKKRARR